MIVLDTDILSILQGPDDPSRDKVEAAIRASADRDLRITIVTVHEAIEGARDYLMKGKQQRRDLLSAYRRYASVVDHVAGWRGRILGYDAESLAVFNGHPTAMRRVAEADRRIAAIASRHGATLWTRNLKDYAKAEGVTVLNPLA